MADQFFKQVITWIEQFGIRETIGRVKKTRSAVLRYFTGQPVISEGVSLDSSGWPIWLREVKFETPGDDMTPLERDKIRYYLTVLSSLRGIILPPVYDFASIVNKDKATRHHIDPMERNLVLKMMFSKSRPRRIVSWEGFHFTTKAGPNGPALRSSFRELPILPLTMVSDMKSLAGDGLNSWLDFFRLELLALFPKSTNYCLSKLACFGDKEGKTRIVAIGDYWTQSVLKPYHKFYLGLLAGLKTDCTFDQGSFKSILTFPGPYYSLDLSNATDRMPMWLQRDIFAYFHGTSKALAWARLLTDRDWVIPKEALRDNEMRKMFPNSSLRYSVGQPMGLYSS
jgi:hypothetical protein